jgi:hypothetical protein
MTPAVQQRRSVIGRAFLSCPAFSPPDRSAAFAALTFGSISALYGLTNHIIDQHQYTILLTAVIGSAVVPTLIAQKWFMPQIGAAKQEV